MRAGFVVSILIAVLLGLAAGCFAQVAAPKLPKEIFRDSDGNLVSNNEFVDIRMANFLYPDATVVTILEDGRKEFQLQKVPQEGSTAPTPVLKTIDGKLISLLELRGKVIVLNFWFIGCSACRTERPKLNELRAKFATDPNVVFIAMTPDRATDVKRYLAKEPIDYIHAHGRRRVDEAIQLRRLSEKYRHQPSRRDRLLAQHRTCVGEIRVGDPYRGRQELEWRKNL